jgi:hypothetical protein
MVTVLLSRLQMIFYARLMTEIEKILRSSEAHYQKLQLESRVIKVRNQGSGFYSTRMIHLDDFRKTKDNRSGNLIPDKHTDLPSRQPSLLPKQTIGQMAY